MKKQSERITRFCTKTSLDVIKELMNLPYKHVYKPVNTLSIDNPDLLMYTEGGLFAFFVPMQKELDNPDFLLRRVISSRLSYINNMKTILITPREIKGIDNNILCQAFHHITFDDNKENIGKLLRDKSFSSIARPISHDVQIEIQRRYANCILISELMHTKSESYSLFELGKKSTFEVRSWVAPQTTKHINDAYDDNDVFLIFKNLSKSSIKESIENVFTYGMLMCHRLENGEILINHKYSQLTKVVNSGYKIINDQNQDSMKYARALAMMGFSVVRISSYDEVEEIRRIAYGEK